MVPDSWAPSRDVNASIGNCTYDPRGVIAELAARGLRLGPAPGGTVGDQNPSNARTTQHPSPIRRISCGAGAYSRLKIDMRYIVFTALLDFKR